jgi:hypothetical protein
MDHTRLTTRIEALSEKLKPLPSEGIRIDFSSFTEPEQLLAKDTLNEGATTYKTADDFENHQLQILRNQLKQLIRQEATV